MGFSLFTPYPKTHLSKCLKDTYHQLEQNPSKQIHNTNTSYLKDLNFPSKIINFGKNFSNSTKRNQSFPSHNNYSLKLQNSHILVDEEETSMQAKQNTHSYIEIGEAKTRKIYRDFWKCSSNLAENLKEYRWSELEF